MATSKRLLIAIEAVNRTREEFGEIENGVERLRKARLANSRVTLEEVRTLRYLRQVYRAQHQGYYDTIGIMRNVGYIGSSILRMWQAHNIAQLRVQDSLDSVAEAQRNVNTALELYGENSVIYQDAVKSLEDMQEAADKAKGDQTMGIIGLGLSAVGTASQVGLLIAKLGEPGMAGTLIGALEAALAAAAPLAVILPGLLSPWLSTEEEKEEAAANIRDRQNIAGRMIDMGVAQQAQAYGAITITQINYGVEGMEDAIDRLRDEIARGLWR